MAELNLYSRHLRIFETLEDLLVDLLKALRALLKDLLKTDEKTVGNLGTPFRTYLSHSSVHLRQLRTCWKHLSPS